MKTSERKAFTMVEILVVTGIATAFIGTAVMLLVNFRQSFSRSENTAILMQEGAMFVARLRTDLNNAVLTGDIGSVPVDQQLAITADKLRFLVYRSADGKTVPVVYSFEAGANGGSLLRKEAESGNKMLVKDHVASLSWEVQLEKFPTTGSETFRLGISLALQLKTSTGREAPFNLQTVIFPARLNRQLNSP
jgi:type II secretory pathway pseudopilin PulG